MPIVRPDPASLRPDLASMLPLELRLVMQQLVRENGEIRQDAYHTVS